MQSATGGAPSYKNLSLVGLHRPVTEQKHITPLPSGPLVPDSSTIIPSQDPSMKTQSFPNHKKIIKHSLMVIPTLRSHPSPHVQSRLQNKSSQFARPIKFKGVVSVCLVTLIFCSAAGTFESIRAEERQGKWLTQPWEFKGYFPIMNWAVLPLLCAKCSVRDLLSGAIY
nr:MAG: hypothetical protein ADFBMEEK_00004 [Peromyscus leucopus gammaherpesvirus]